MFFKCTPETDDVVEVNDDLKEVHVANGLLHWPLERGWSSCYALKHAFDLEEKNRADNSRIHVGDYCASWNGDIFEGFILHQDFDGFFFSSRRG